MKNEIPSSEKKKPALLKAASKPPKDPDDLPFSIIEPWPNSVDPSALLNEISGTIRRFIVCPVETVHAATLWIAMTWCIDVIHVAPLAVITAPEKRCGKSQLLFLIGRLVNRPLAASNITPSALFRSIDKWHPTLLIDEADAFLKDNEELRGLLNCGHTRDSAFTIRTVGESFTPKRFDVWGAKALAGIGKLADTLMDRAIPLELRRKTADEVTDRLRYAEEGLFEDLASKLARFSEDYAEEVRTARPPFIPELHDRAQDNWEPLLAIAMVAGGEWPTLARQAAIKISGDASHQLSIGVELLADIQEIFEMRHTDRIATRELIEDLCADEERPWATYNRGFRISPKQVAERLKGYGVHSSSMRIPGAVNAKGYYLKQFEDAFTRYLPTIPDPDVTPSQPSNDVPSSVTRGETVPVTPPPSVTPRAAPALNCDAVTDYARVRG